MSLALAISVPTRVSGQNVDILTFLFCFIITYRGSQGVSMTNTEFAKNDSSFRTACEAVGLEPTARQASKWRMGFGLAFTKGRKAAKGKGAGK